MSMITSVRTSASRGSGTTHLIFVVRCLAALLTTIGFDGARSVASAQAGPRLLWDETSTSDVAGYAVVIDGVRTDYGLSPIAANGSCGCSIGVPFSGGYHTIIVGAYNANSEALSAPLDVGPVAVAGGSCLFDYARSTNTLRLLNDDGITYQQAIVGSAGSLQNSLCTIALGPATMVTTTATQLTLTVAMTFSRAYKGDKNVYLYAGGQTVSSGWQKRGKWKVRR